MEIVRSRAAVSSIFHMYYENAIIANNIHVIVYMNVIRLLMGVMKSAGHGRTENFRLTEK